MAYPSAGTERARPDIAETFLEMDLEMNIQNLVASQVLPVREVQYAHGTYPAVTLKELMANSVGRSDTGTGAELTRSPKGEYFRDELSFVERTYRTREYGIEGPVDDNEAAHYASMLEHEAMTALWLRHRMLIAQERRVASEAFSTTRFTGQTAAAGVLWSTPATADPFADVLVAKLDVVATYGMWPDTMIINRIAWNHLRETDQIRSRVHGQGAGEPDRARNISRGVVADILDLDEIIVAQGIEDSANANATFAGAHIWGDSALVFKKIRGNSIREIGLGHTLHWSADGSQPSGMVEEYREPQSRQNVLRVRHQTQDLFKYNIGFLITSVYA